MRNAMNIFEPDRSVAIEGISTIAGSDKTTMEAKKLELVEISRYLKKRGKQSDLVKGAIGPTGLRVLRVIDELADHLSRAESVEKTRRHPSWHIQS